MKKSLILLWCGKWACPVALVLVAAAWIASERWRIAREFFDRAVVLLQPGQIRIEDSPAFAITVFEARQRQRASFYVADSSGFDLILSFPEWCGNPAVFLAPSITIPFWSIAAVLVVGAGVAWASELRAHRAVRMGLCPTCRYNLTGLPARTPCPECGKRASKGGAS